MEEEKNSSTENNWQKSWILVVGLLRQTYQLYLCFFLLIEPNIFLSLLVLSSNKAKIKRNLCLFAVPIMNKIAASHKRRKGSTVSPNWDHKTCWVTIDDPFIGVAADPLSSVLVRDVSSWSKFLLGKWLEYISLKTLRNLFLLDNNTNLRKTYWVYYFLYNNSGIFFFCFPQIGLGRFYIFPNNNRKQYILNIK